MKVQVADVLGNKKEKYLGFSYPYVFLGPFYLLFRLRFVSGIILLILYYYFLPIYGMESLVESLLTVIKDGFWRKTLEDSFLLFRHGFTDIMTYIGIIYILIIHGFLSFFVEGILLKKFLKKKKMYPVSEQDARKLIYSRAAKPDVLLASSYSIEGLKGYKSAEQRWLENNTPITKKNFSAANTDNLSSNPLKVTLDNSKHANDIKTQLEYYQAMYNAGEITKEIFDLKRAEILSGKTKK